MSAKVRKVDGGYEATCPECQWLYWSRSLPSAHTEATHHTCLTRLGPRRLPAGTAIDGIGSPLQVWVEPMTVGHRPEVWL